MNKLIKISSLSGTFLIFCGILKLMIYYSAFNINIIDFLSLPEIITSFLDDLNILILFIFIMCVLSFAYINVEKRKYQIKIEDYMEGYLMAIYPFRYRFTAVYVFLVLALILLIYFDFIGYNYIVIYLFFFSALQIFAYLIMTKTEDNKIEMPNLSLVFSIIFSIILSVFLLAEHDIQKTETNSSEAILYTKSSRIFCGKKMHYTYLGKTDHYIFIKRNEIKSGIAISTEIVDMIEFR